VIQQQMGHPSIKITYDTYAKRTPVALLEYRCDVPFKFTGKIERSTPRGAGLQGPRSCESVPATAGTRLDGLPRRSPARCRVFRQEP
jgi:hypothetical protein